MQERNRDCGASGIDMSTYTDDERLYAIEVDGVVVARETWASDLRAQAWHRETASPDGIRPWPGSTLVLVDGPAAVGDRIEVDADGVATAQ